MVERVLVIDDEYPNIETLLHFFLESDIDHDYCPTISEAALMIATAQREGQPYSVVICDNHFHDDDLQDYSPNFNGVDFARILAGDVSGEGYLQFVSDFFRCKQLYQRILSQYDGRIIIFSGSALADSFQNPALFEGIEVVQKYPDEDGCCCEQELLAVLAEMGLIFDTNSYVIASHKLNNGLSEGTDSRFEIKPDPDVVYIDDFLAEEGNRIDPSYFD